MAPETIYRRKIYDRMLEWKKGEGSTALLIEGARRVGKTTVVREFAKNEYRSFIMIDFSDCDDDVRNLSEPIPRVLTGSLLVCRNLRGRPSIRGGASSYSTRSSCSPRPDS